MDAWANSIVDVSLPDYNTGSEAKAMAKPLMGTKFIPPKNEIKLPPKDRWKILCNQILIIRPKLFHIGPIIRLAIQIKRIESSHPGEHCAVVIVHEVVVS